MKKILAIIGVVVLFITIVGLSGCSDTPENTGGSQSSDIDTLPSGLENATVVGQGFSGYITLVLKTPGVNYPTGGYLASDIRIYVGDAKVTLSSGSYNFSTWQVTQYIEIGADDAGVAFGLLGVGSEYGSNIEYRDEGYSVKVVIKGSIEYNNIISVS